MGYCTRFNLEYQAKKDCFITKEMEQEMKDFFNDMIECEDAWDEITSGDYTDDQKWYEHTEDMQKMARVFPDVIFILEGEGEDRKDWWVERFCGDKYGINRAQVFEPSFYFPEIPEASI